MSGCDGFSYMYIPSVRLSVSSDIPVLGCQ